ncbi:MAG: right-handed parallel beta-helix repeat-containing protein, partial [Planctomycetota bacterium]
GDDKVGGLVGVNNSVNYDTGITNSYSTGAVRGDKNVGGLVGFNPGHLTACFWDIVTSGQAESAGGTGKTTAEMQMAITFVGWLCDPVWTLDEGRDYPRLWWENALGEPIMYTLYVDDDAPDDPGPGDPQISDPLEDGSQAHPFDTIQEAIDVAPDCSTVLVRRGQYLKPQSDDTIDFCGKNITLRSSDPTNWDTVNSTVIRGSVQFSGAEGPNCRLKGFRIHDPHYGAIYGNNTRATISYCVISGNGPCGATVVKDCDGTISNCLITDNTTFFFCGVLPVVSGCDGLIKNCTIANNISGVSVGTATIENCIIYDNAGSQLGVSMGETLSISYSNVQGGLEAIVGDGDVVWGPGNIDMDPRFVRLGYWWEEPLELTEGDYHLRSEGWHWYSEGKSWTNDYVTTSRCIDAGNPDSPLGEELMSVPRDLDNEWGVNLRINMGAYGGTAQASMPPLGWTP